jgi:hypothetical protein
VATDAIKSPLTPQSYPKTLPASPLESPMPRIVLLATLEAGDLGLVPRSRAVRLAREQADNSGLPVWIRHPISDTVIRVIRPRG